MRFLIVLIWVALLSGCSKIDREQVLSDCRFNAIKAKLSDAEYTDYIFSCMDANGYRVSLNEGCSSVYTSLPDCWSYSWRVFLH